MITGRPELLYTTMVRFALFLSTMTISVTAQTPNECFDNHKKFRINQEGQPKRRCKGWEKSGFCGTSKVDRLCPVTCGICSCKNFIGKFPYNNNRKSCNWVINFKTEFRCKKRLIMAYCPETCGVCDDIKSQTNSPTLSPTVSPTASPADIICLNNKPFSITLMNMGSNTNYDAAFASAKAKWESIIKCDLPDIGAQPEGFDWFNGQFAPKSYRGSIDDILIGFNLDYIDGVSNILGFAGATFVRNGFSSPISGIMVFDSADFDTMSQNDAEIIILHEMGHILGLVNVRPGRCHSPCDTGNYQYGLESNCALASNEYAKLNLGIGPLKVEDGNEGGECGHWEEDSFPKSSGSSELMTGLFESGLAQPITRVTIAALDEAYNDYVVDYSVADPFPFRASFAHGARGRSELKSKVYYPDTTFTIGDILPIKFKEIPN